MRKRLKTIYLGILILLVAPTIYGQNFPQPRPLTDEEEIQLLLINIEQGIKEQNILKITDGFDRVYEIGDTITARYLLWDRLQSSFRNSQNRLKDSLFQLITPKKANISYTWDFELEIDTIRVLNDNSAKAVTKMFFSAYVPDSSSGEHYRKKQKEIIMFNKVDGEWRIKKVDKLMRFISKYGDM